MAGWMDGWMDELQGYDLLICTHPRMRNSYPPCAMFAVVFL